MPRKEYAPLSGGPHEDDLSEGETLSNETELELGWRTNGRKMLKVTLGFAVLATFLSAMSVYLQLRPLDNASPFAMEPKILNYFLTSPSGRTAPRIVERTYWDYDDEFLNENLTIAHEAWMGLMPPGEGLVALDDEEVKSLQLPRSNRAKKDPSKSIYLVGVFHQLHCLSVLRSQTIKLWKDPSFSIQDATYHHTMHCADILRQTLLCASDSLLIFKTDDIKWPGDGGKMTCRNFDALKEWTMAHDYISE